MTVIRSRVMEAGGLSFAVDEAGEGDAVALLLHGFPESRRSWSAQLPALAELGWRAVAPDLRGYGGSSRPLGQAAYQMDRLCEDVAALFDALGARRRLLVGHDWGGLIAWAFASATLRPLEGLVVMNAPHPAAYRAEIARNPVQWARSWYVLFFQLPWLPEALLTAAGAMAVRGAFPRHPAFTPELLDHYAAGALAPGAMTAMVNYYRANASALGRWERTSTPIAAPTLVIWGERDPFLESGLAEASAALATIARVERLPNAGHWVQQEDAAQVNARLAAWMRETGLTQQA